MSDLEDDLSILDQLGHSEEWSKLGTHLRDIDICQCGVDHLMGVLRVTVRWRDVVAEWAPFRDRVCSELISRKVDVNDMMRGLWLV